MAELLDRPFQRTILEMAAGAYPNPLALSAIPADHPRRLLVNVAYLSEHGLLVERKGISQGAVTHHPMVTITAKGIDFLADDGGLSAILGVVSVRLHEDTVKQLIAAQIERSDLPDTEKRRFLDQLRELPGETTKHLVLKLVDAGLENWHRALPLLQNMMG